MKIAGIIAEFNPFHRGHKYIIEKAREDLNADLVIILMSGNFVQRGEPAVFDLGKRTGDALNNMADMVFELPPHIALSSAEGFASGGVSLLTSLGADYILFGSECGDLEPLEEAAAVLANESEGFKAALNQHLREGLSFPSAREAAFCDVIPEESALNKGILNEILQKPNNILAVEYLKAIKSTASPLIPHTVKRINSFYHGGEKDNGDSLYSAEAIRKTLYLEEDSLDTVFPDSLTPLLLYNLYSPELKEKLKKAAVPPGLSERIVNNRNYSGSFSGFCSLLKTKNITYTSVSRHLLHLILDMDYKRAVIPDYIRLLGFRKDSEGYFSELKKRSRIPILSNSSDLRKCRSESLREHLRIDQTYNLLKSPRKGKAGDPEFSPEISRQIIII